MAQNLRQGPTNLSKTFTAAHFLSPLVLYPQTSGLPSRHIFQRRSATQGPVTASFTLLKLALATMVSWSYIRTQIAATGRRRLRRKLTSVVVDCFTAL